MIFLMNKAQSIRLSMLIVVFFLAVSINAYANNQSSRLENAENIIINLLADIKAKKHNESASNNEMRQQIEPIIDRYFDFYNIARYAVGRYWRTATDAEKQDYKNLFKMSLIQQTYQQFNQIRNLDFTPTKTIERGEKFIIVTGIVRDKSGNFPDTEVSFRLINIEGQNPKIIDLEVENISMLKTQQDINVSILRRAGGDFSVLLKSLQDKINAPPQVKLKS